MTRSSQRLSHLLKVVFSKQSHTLTDRHTERDRQILIKLISLVVIKAPLQMPKAIYFAWRYHCKRQIYHMERILLTFETVNSIRYLRIWDEFDWFWRTGNVGIALHEEHGGMVNVNVVRWSRLKVHDTRNMPIKYGHPTLCRWSLETDVLADIWTDLKQ